jgi:hypothetical protein
MTQLDILAALEPQEVRLARLYPERFAPDFVHWLLDNFAIWRAFDKAADALWQTGVAHFGARCIWEHLRYETALRERDSDYKLNDHRPPDLARLWLLKYPNRLGFFETRVSEKSTKRAA